MRAFELRAFLTPVEKHGRSPAQYGHTARSLGMCRNIKTLANFAPPATEDEIRASALQFVRKLSGANRPSRANEPAFNRAVEEVTAAANRLIHSLTTSAPPRNRDEEARKAQERGCEKKTFFFFFFFLWGLLVVQNGQFQSQRNGPVVRRRSGHAAALVSPRRSASDRHQVRLRRRAVRRLHGARRRPGGQVVPDAGADAAEQTGGHD